MLLDAGNSRIKWCWMESGELGEMHYLNYRQFGQDRLKLIASLLQQQRPEKLILVHVLGDGFEQTVRRVCDEFGFECHFARSQHSCCQLLNGYDNPEQLGADRFVAMIAAYHLSDQHAVIVVDCGTAVTIDAIAANGQHLGGVIMPGLQLWANSLITNTELKQVAENVQPRAFTSNTQNAIHSGRLLGLSGAIDNICNIMQKDMSDSPIERIICGGDASAMVKLLPPRYRLEPDLVLHGLKIINEKVNA